MLVLEYVDSTEVNNDSNNSDGLKPSLGDVGCDCMIILVVLHNGYYSEFSYDKLSLSHVC